MCECEMSTQNKQLPNSHHHVVSAAKSSFRKGKQENHQKHALKISGRYYCMDKKHLRLKY